jgi:hypothetical protein
MLRTRPQDKQMKTTKSIRAPPAGITGQPGRHNTLKKLNAAALTRFPLLFL